MPAQWRPGALLGPRHSHHPHPYALPLGDADVALSLRTTRGTEKYVSNLAFRVFPGVSHCIQQEAPDEVNAMLEAWLLGRRVPEYSELRESH